jgi:asparagine synthase (glutamine-hydrolysing)
MCGIVGTRRFDGVAIDPGSLRAMAGPLAHRGPDDEGYWVGRVAGLGHRRLAIIDPAGSRQPMACGAAHVSFNGEIFNYVELRRELAAAGHEFSSRGDTEVLLALWLRHGRDGVRRLDGQFAYAIWDDALSELWLFRDRLGVLPLYYHFDGAAFHFASEIKALLPVVAGGAEVDDESLRDYLAHRSVPWPHTLFRGIRKLPPGHSLRLGPTGALAIEPWWSLPTAAAERATPAPRAVDAVEQALARAVESRLVADVPVGAFLSGGVDSSLVVALMARARGGAPVETFCAGFDDPRFDDVPHAREVSRLLGTRHHEALLEPRDFEALWPLLSWHRDGPISEPADVAIFRLAQLARPIVKVLLSGEGADELFAGYPKHRFAGWTAAAGLLPAGLRGALLSRADAALPARAGRLRIAVRALGAASEADRLQTWFAPFTLAERGRLLPGGVERAGHRELFRRTQGDALQRMLYVDCHTWLVDNLLERGDRMSMAASVECRPPFLDHHLVELAFRIPSSLKVRAGRGKWVLKEVARRHLPERIVDRRKVGFRVPVGAWLRGGLREMARDLLQARDGFVGTRMDRVAVDRLFADHESGRRDEEIRLWTLLALEIWHRAFFRGAAAPPVTGCARSA